MTIVKSGLLKLWPLQWRLPITAKAEKDTYIIQ